MEIRSWAKRQLIIHREKGAPLAEAPFLCDDCFVNLKMLFLKESNYLSKKTNPETLQI